MDHNANATFDAGLDLGTIQATVQSVVSRGLLATLQTTSTKKVLWACAVVFVVYQVGLTVYRLFFIPIAKYPGPKLAAASFWYEFYFDVIKFGRVGIIRATGLAFEIDGDCSIIFRSPNCTNNTVGLLL